MPEIMKVKVKGWTQTLEASVTSASGVENGRKIELDYPISKVSGVFDNSSGTGTNYWTEFADGTPQAKSRSIKHFGKYILLPSGTTLAASTNCWVTYNVWNGYMSLAGALTPDGQVVLPSASSSGLSHNFTGFTEMSSVTSGTPVEVPINPATGGLSVNSVKVITDGTNINLYVYSASTASYANLLYRLDGINLSSIDNSEWIIPTSNTSVWVGYQDVGANATPANTTVWINGTPIV
ncbi:MAG: hypothetical protein DRP09_12180 [Candidatus Thorarchaeota archaeon]|nr:MAG: hypothetical protein DRP09_12180 [Candidatus Thorarchaeota archaeon]